MVDLTRCSHVDQVIGLNFNLVSRWKKRVEPHNEIRVTLKELRHPADYAWGVNTLRFKLLHNIQEVIVDLWLIAKLELYLIQVRQSILHLESLELLLALCGCRRGGRMSVTLYGCRSVGLSRRRAMVMRPAVHRRTRSVTVTTGALGHCGHLVCLRKRVLYSWSGLHAVSHRLEYSRRWGQNPVLEALSAAGKPALLWGEHWLLIL